MAEAFAPITSADVANYHLNGWVRLSSLMDPRHLPGLDAEVMALLPTMTHDTWKGPWQDEEADLLTVHQIHEKPIWNLVATGAEMLSVAAALMGVPRASVSQSTAILKPPRHGQMFPPHQDSAYYDKHVPDAMVAMFHLDATTPENGPLRYLDGSHISGRLPHSRRGKKHIPTVSLDEMTEVCAERGDVVCANLHTVHGSYPNRSDAMRRLVRVVYHAEF